MLDVDVSDALSCFVVAMVDVALVEAAPGVVRAALDAVGRAPSGVAAVGAGKGGADDVAVAAWGCGAGLPGLPVDAAAGCATPADSSADVSGPSEGAALAMVLPGWLELGSASFAAEEIDELAPWIVAEVEGSADEEASVEEASPIPLSARGRAGGGVGGVGGTAPGESAVPSATVGVASAPAEEASFLPVAVVKRLPAVAMFAAGPAASVDGCGASGWAAI